MRGKERRKRRIEVLIRYDYDDDAFQREKRS
jgi:hypothetical protein